MLLVPLSLFNENEGCGWSVVHLQEKDQAKTVQEDVQQQMATYRNSFSRILPQTQISIQRLHPLETA